MKPLSLVTIIVVIAAVLAILAAAIVGFRLGRSRRVADRSDLARAARELATAQASATLANELLADALEGFPHGVILFEANGNVRLANTGGKRFIQPRVDDALVAAGLRELLAAGPGSGRAQRTVTLAGPSATVFELSVSWPGRQGRRDAVAVVEDVTARHRLEQMRSDFVANISHELRTPIGAMALLAETLADDDDLERMKRLATRIHEEAMRLAQTVSDLQSLSLLEGEAVDTGTVAIDEVIEAAIERVAGHAESLGVRILRQLGGEGAILEANFGQLVSALANLLDNGVKYSSAGGEVRLDVAADQDKLVITVSDDGIGIPTRDLKRIFERFYRVDRARSRETGGTGLGLAIVRHVATNHQGDVSVSSVEGEGSTFNLTLPRR